MAASLRIGAKGARALAVLPARRRPLAGNLAGALPHEVRPDACIPRPLRAGCRARRSPPYLSPMASDRIHFGAVLDRGTGDGKIWLIVIPVVLLVIAGIVWGAITVSRSGSYQAEAASARAQLAELQRSLDERDKLLVQARKDEAILTSAGQATGLFLGVAGDATESGVVLANPGERAARVVLYGLVAPPEGREYVVAARDAQGARKPLGKVIPTETGTGFLLARDMPEGTASVELLLREAGAETLDGATPRVAARYPATAEERGILMQPEAKPAQARRGRR